MADNALGRAKKYIEVSGRPGPAQFHSPLYSRSRDIYNLTWSVESVPKLDEIRILYRKLMVSDYGFTRGRHECADSSSNSSLRIFSLQNSIETLFRSSADSLANRIIVFTPPLVIHILRLHSDFFKRKK